MERLACDRFKTTCIIEGQDFTTKVFIDKQNKRVKLIECKGNKEKAVNELIEFSSKQGMGKIITVMKENEATEFLTKEFVAEGKIEGYFKGEDGFCISYFIDKDRSKSKRIIEEEEILKKAFEHSGDFVYTDNEAYRIRTATEDDAESITEIFNKVFTSYPTPMDNPEYVKDIMKQNVLFKIAEKSGKIISVASADMDTAKLNAEMTDCATLPEYRGKGLLGDLIFQLEEELREKRYITLFSLSRALSTGINIVFSKHGYVYSGRQINNCDIMGKFEDMNLWVKKLIYPIRRGVTK
ncbi:MAG: putative beta-lysine N-acetyltransferase [Firmicutes bacterium HGW-Firmicutes-12]|jgi:putative beta-lysine N-acetyltransferase|nr:MAG: putative beta-lysine N-acetyltransferase [Firmicutes bacterium HGW-Firmicutes-12]